MPGPDTLEPGTVRTLTVARMSDLGAFLDAGTGKTTDDILLHKAQQTQDVTVGEKVAVYLYLDPKRRLTASMRLPQMREGQVAWTTIVNTTKDGAFVDIGTERGVFMPFAEMRGKVRRGDKVWVKLYRDKSGRMAVTMDVTQELLLAARPAENVKVGDTVTGSIYNATAEGFFLFTTERYIAFLHNNELLQRPKVGEEITARVTYVREDGKINVSMRPVKEAAIDIDAANILAVLTDRGGKMPYCDDTSPLVIKQKFNISKAAFKRAMGQLIRRGLITQREGWTYLDDRPDESAPAD